MDSFHHLVSKLIFPMKFDPSLEQVILQKRYKRFLADVKLPNGELLTVHCPNTGSMKNCWAEGWNAWLQKSDNPKRKYAYTWTLAQNECGELIGINTHLANALVVEGIENNKIKQIASVKTIQREVKYGEENSKIDILITHHDNALTYIEVKSVTLKESDGKGYFPDAVTTRGQKHLRELMACVDQGHRAVLLFMVQHSGINEMSIAAQIDPKYAALIKKAIEHGVEVLAYKADISETEIYLDKEISFIN